MLVDAKQKRKNGVILLDEQAPLHATALRTLIYALACGHATVLTSVVDLQCLAAQKSLRTSRATAPYGNKRVRLLVVHEQATPEKMTAYSLKNIASVSHGIVV